MSQASEVLPGIKAAIHRAKKEEIDLIIEGIHPIPSLLNRDNEIVKFVITVSSEEKHKEQLFGQGDHRSTYKLDNFIKARDYQNFLINDAATSNATIIQNQTIQQSTKEIKSKIIHARKNEQ